MHEDFIHLRTHSAYSLSEGAIKADKIAAMAAEARMPAAAITDTSNLFGALEFSQACAGRGVQPIIGCQLFLTRGDAPRAAPDALVLLAKDEAGFANLRRLSSRSFLDSDPLGGPQVSLDLLLAHQEGLIVLTGGQDGPLFRLLAEGRKGDAERLLGRLCEGFGDRVAVELNRFNTELERAIEPGLIQLADAAGVPLVATNNCMFPVPSMHQAHDVLLCIAEGRQVQEVERRRVSPEQWFKPAAAMRALFADLPEACANTLAIAQRCAVMAETCKPLLPRCPKVLAGQTEAETLVQMAQAGLAKRMDAAGADAAMRARYGERLAYELGVISSMGFDGYFLIVADFIQWSKAQDIPVGPGRGSGAGSVVAWALTITDLDPLRFDLLFERFLNPERISMPDFDIDFCQDRRDEVIAYVRREYGGDRVAQIITFGKLQARAAVRDVGRVLGLPFGQVNKVCELIPNNPAKPVTLQQAIVGEARIRQMQADDEAVARLLEIALQLEGLYRHASTHAAGVVIGDRPLMELVPLYRDPKSDFLVTQYSMKYVEQAGLVKFDFLGLTTLTILQRAVRFLRDIGVGVDLENLALDDAKTYEMLGSGDAAGVFQFESAGMRDVLRQMRPDRFEDLIAGVALYRPGPMANIPDYCKRKHGEPWAPPHESLHDVLAETYGIMVYQEQVMQIAQQMGGYSLGAADLLRRAMGKKIRAEMEQQRKIFTDGATARGITPAKAEEVFDLMAKFADYGFNKSHAAAYALVAYQTAWMKANQPVAFLAACMSLAIDNTDKLAALRQEANRLGIAVLPPDINRSGADFVPEQMPDGSYGIRYALAAVKRVGLAAMRSMEVARGGTPFASIADFAGRIDPRAINKMQIENLVRAGAFDSLDARRASVFGGADSILRRAQAEMEQKTSGQVALFGNADGPDALALPKADEWQLFDRIAFEAEAIGFHLTAHPLDAYAATLRRLGAILSSRIAVQARAGGRVRLAGSVVNVKERTTAKGSRMAWVRLSDGAGSYEVTLFSETLQDARALLSPGAMVLVTADLKSEGEALRITATDVTSLDDAVASVGASLRVWIGQTEAVPHIRALLEREPTSIRRGRPGRVMLVPRLDDAQLVEVTLPGHYNVTPRLAQALTMLPGVERVEDM